MSSRRVLLLHAHPAPHKSRVNRLLVREAEELGAVTVRHLYEIYPDFLIDVKMEQRLMVAHDVIVLQHPFYWYSAPSLVKEWMDLVLEHGWAYGTDGLALRGKTFVQAVTCGGGAEVYCNTGRNGHTVRDFLLPFEQSARLCGMIYPPPFVVYGTGDLKSEDDVAPHAASYRRMLEALLDGGVDLQSLNHLD